MSTVETTARASLRADGRFCVVVGALVALAARTPADPLGLRPWSTIAAGLAGLTALAVLWFAVTQSIIRLNAGAAA